MICKRSNGSIGISRQGLELYYLDYNATAPFSPSVVQYITCGMAKDWANASSEHDLGFALYRRLKSAKEDMAAHLDCDPGSLIFTSGATESINTVLSPHNLASLGVKVVLSNKMEHSATLDRLKFLGQFGVETYFAKTTPLGEIDYSHLENLARDYPRSLISLVWANNETGIITDLSRVTAICKEYHCLLHVDAVQALGKIPVSLESLDADYASFSGHKIGAFKGVGLLYVAAQNKIEPLMHGGGATTKLRPGTINFPAIYSFSLALKDILQVDVVRNCKERDHFETQILKEIPGIKINGYGLNRLCNTSSIVLPNMTGKQAMLALGSKGIYVSTGSACSSGSEEPSHVMVELLRKEHCQNIIRISSDFLSRQSYVNDGGVFKTMISCLSP